MSIFASLFGQGKEPIDAKEWTNKGAAFATSGHHNEAIRCYDKALKADPGLALPWYDKSKSLAALGRAKEATDCIRKAANLGLAEAQQVCEQSGTIYKPHELDAGAMIDEGIALGQRAEWQEAIACYDKALEITPENPKAWINKGQALSKLGRAQEAIGSLQQFIKYAKPEDAKIVAAVRAFIQKLEAQLGEN